MRGRKLWFAAAGLLTAAGGGAFLLCGSEGSAEPLPIANIAFALPEFGTLPVARPEIVPQGLAVIVEDPRDFDSPAAAGAQALAQRGWAAARVPAKLVEKKTRAPGGCLKANEALVRLSQELEHRMRMPTYMKPVLVGIGPGTAVTGELATNAPSALYSGVVQAEPEPADPLTVFRCPPPERPSGHSNDIPARRRLGFPIRTLPDMSKGGSELADAVSSLQLPQGQEEAEIPPGLADLPLTVVNSSAGANGDTMAVLLSGDGGWAGLDHDLAQSIAEAGVPVVGLDSLRYFWTARTPEQLGGDVARIVSTYSAIWNRPRVLLIGYSFGADALTRAIPVSPAWLKPHIDRVSLVGLSAAADFQFHLGTWLDISAPDALPTVPGIKAMKGLSVQCIRGANEADSACPLVPASAARKFVLPGGHHLNNDVDRLASIILRGAPA